MPGELYSVGPVSDESMLKQSEIMAMRALADGQQALVKRIESMDSKLGGVHDTVIRLEERNKRVDEITDTVRLLEARVNLLESAADKRSGMATLIEISKNYAPWLIAIVAAIGALRERLAPHP